MRVVFLSPSYPPEMIQYTRGLAEVGAEVLGVGDTPREALPAAVKPHLHDYLQVPRIMDEDDVIARVTAWLRGKTVDRVDGTVDNALDSTNLTLATREQVSAGAEIHGPDGKSIGTVQSVEGGTAVVMRGGKLYNVPLSEVYHGAVGATHGLVTKLSSAEVKAHTSAAVE